MSDGKIKLRIEGGSAEVVAKELSDLIESEFEQKPEQIEQRPIENKTGDPKKIDIGAVAAITAVVISIPSAILATVDLVDRFRKKEKIDRIIEWAEQQRKKDPEIIVQIEIPGALCIDLHKAESAKLFDEVNKLTSL